MFWEGGSKETCQVVKLCSEAFEEGAVDFRGSILTDTEGEEMLFAEIGRGEVVWVPEENYQC